MAKSGRIEVGLTPEAQAVVDGLRLEVKQVCATARVHRGANKILAEEVETLRDVIARLAEVEQWDEYHAVMSELDGYPSFEGWKR